METIEKYTDCKKEDVIRKVPEDLWCDWLAQASDEDRADVAFMKKLVLRRGECLKFAPDLLRSDQGTVLKIVKSCPSAIVYESEELQNDRKFIKQAVNINAEVIKYVSENNFPCNTNPETSRYIDGFGIIFYPYLDRIALT